jgi:hypothetical protein
MNLATDFVRIIFVLFRIFAARQAGGAASILGGLSPSGKTMLTG